jgi:hypothetical protein
MQGKIVHLSNMMIQKSIISRVISRRTALQSPLMNHTQGLLVPFCSKKLYPYRKAAKVAFILFQKLFLAIVLPMTFLKPKHVLF